MFKKKFLILMKNFIFIFFIILYKSSYSQQFLLVDSIGNFQNASSFYITSNGYLYVTDKGRDEVYHLDTLGNLLKDVGGFGWNQSQFDEPVDVFADPLSVYVTDKNNHRIQRFDRKLNFISQLYTRENDNIDERFGYPLGCVVSNQGDLYILDSENNRVLKFDLFGNYILNFGGIEAGEFSLKSPTSLTISSNGIIFVSDNNSLIAFDQFGNGIKTFEFDSNINSVKIIFNKMVLTTNNEIYIADMKEAETKFKMINLNLNNNYKIISALFFQNKLYILTPTNILIFLPANE